MPPVTIPSYTKAGLPSTPAAGDLARVTDTVQGVWLADGTTAASWFSVLGEIANVKDFGAKGDGSTNDQTAIQNAVNAATGIVYFPPGMYICQSAITLKRGVTLAGAGCLVSIIKFTAATQGLVFIAPDPPAAPLESQINLRDLGIYGIVGTTKELIRFKNATQMTIRNVNVRDTNVDCINIETCYEFSILQCRIENATQKGVRLLTSNVWTIQDCSFQGNAVASEAHVYIDGSGWGGIRESNFEASNVVQHAIQLSGTAIEIANNFMEDYTGSVIQFLSTAASSLVRIARNHIHSGNVNPQILIDGGTTLAHTGIDVDANRFNGVNGGTCFSPGSAASTFVYRFTSRGFTGTDVSGFADAEVERYASPIRQKEARLLSEGNISGATPSITNLQYVEVHNPSGAVTMTNLLGGARDQQVTFRFEDNNTTVQSGTNFRLAGGVSKTFAAMNTLTLLNVDGVTWVELCRSIN
jgi:Pectate lyase superfamily protein